MATMRSSLPGHPACSLCLRYEDAWRQSHRSTLTVLIILLNASMCEALTSICTFQDDEEMEKRVTRKLHWHIMSRFVMLTVLNHMDRANLVCCFAFVFQQIHSAAGHIIF